MYIYIICIYICIYTYIYIYIYEYYIYIYIYEMPLHMGITKVSFDQILKHNSNNNIRNGN